ncbi:MFS transporter [Corynebacterium sp. 335C]
MSMRGLPVTVRILLLTEMLFNVGFYLVVPFIAVQMAGPLGAGGAAIGLVLGLRTFSQQGLFFLGGGLSDRFGPRPILLIGVALRIAGFVVAGLAPSVPWMIAGVILIGFAAALFSPAVESTLAVEGLKLERAGVVTRSRIFALDAAWSRIGVLVGPVLGAALIPVGFRLVCMVGAAVFAFIFAAHAVMLSRSRIGADAGGAAQAAAADAAADAARASDGPAADPAGPVPGDAADDPAAPDGGADRVRPASMLAAWGGVLRNRAFLAFAALYSTYLVAYNQQYLALPVELRRATGSDALLGWFFAIASIWVIALQGPVHRRAEKAGAPAALTAGFAVMAASFAVVAAAAPFEIPGAAALLPALVFVLLLNLGEMIAVPVARDLVGDLGGNRDLGSYYGFLSSFGGLAVLIASTALGGMLDAAEAPGAAATVPWLVLAAVMCVSAYGLRRMAQRRAGGAEAAPGTSQSNSERAASRDARDDGDPAHADATRTSTTPSPTTGDDR